jgi:hypothetical protein
MRAELAEEGKFQWLARLGFVTRGLLYILIAFLVLRSGRTEDVTGAIEYVASGVGRWILVFIAAGMTGYGLWRVADSLFGMDSGRHHAKAWRRRIAAGASGLIYLGLAYKTFALLFGDHASGNGAEGSARTALHLPSGQLILYGAALVLAGAGVVQLYKSLSCSFLERLDDRARQPWAKWMGRIGYGARGVIFATAGYLLFRAAMHHDPGEAGGLEQVLDALSSPLRYLVAAGLMIFGAYSIVEARFRSIHKPPVEHIKNEVREATSG